MCSYATILEEIIKVNQTRNICQLGIQLLIKTPHYLFSTASFILTRPLPQDVNSTIHHIISNRESIL